MATWEDLKEYVGASNDQDDYVLSCWDTAVVMVTSVIGTAVVPTVLLDRCYLEAGSELFHRRNAPNGVAQFSAFDGQPVRVARDPLVGVYSLLSRHLVMGL